MGTHPIFESDFDCLTDDIERMSDSHLFGEDLVFADQLLERLNEFTKRESSNPEDAMVLESSGGWHRYIVHQAVQLFPTLSSFSVGEGSKRRPVVCFKAKLPKSLRHNTPGPDRLYQPPHSNSSRPSTDKKKSTDEKLLSQLQNRMRMISLADNRIPNLNPHAASFIPISIQNQNETTDIYQCDVSSTYYPKSNTALNPTVPDFTPRAVTSQRDSSLTKFVETYQEFIPSSSVHKKLPSVRVPTQLPQINPPQSNQSEASVTMISSSNNRKELRSSPPSVSQKKTKMKEAYVPPQRRDRQRFQTEDQIDREKNLAKKEKDMRRKFLDEHRTEQISDTQQSEKLSGYKNFKPTKKKRPPEHEQPRYRPTTREERIPDLRDSIQRNSDSSSDDDNDEEGGSSFEDNTPFDDKMMENWADDDPLVLDQTVIDDISKAVPGLKLKRSYDFAIPSHMLEIYDFPKSVRTADLMNAFTAQYPGFSVRWIDDTHAIAIFASIQDCNEALEKGGCGSFRVRPLTESSDQARKKAAMVAREQRYDLDMEPAERPDTSVVVARRLIAANLDGKIARQIRAAEEEEKLIKGETIPSDEMPRRQKRKSKSDRH